MNTDHDSRLRDAVRGVIKAALDDGMAGPAIIRRLQSEVDRLQEAMPTLSRRQLASITARVAGRYGE